MKIFRKLLICIFAAALIASARAGWSWNFPPNYVNPTTARRNNIFYVGENVNFTVGGSATRYEVRDYYGNLVASNSLAGSYLSLNLTNPGWYKLYLFGNQDQGDPWGYAVGGTTFVIFRNNPNFPTAPNTNISGGFGGLEDEVIRGIAGIGPQRLHVDNASDPDTAIAQIEQDVALDETWYMPYDSARKRDLLIAFPNGTSDLAGVRKIVDHFKDRVKYYEGRNEPNFSATGTQFIQNELIPFYQTVKSVSPNLKVVGPGIVSLSLIGWIDEFLNQGGAKYIDAFSFHAYNNINGDIWLGRTAIESLKSQLKQYGVPNIEIWQTEQGNNAAMYGVYQPRHQGAWTMLQMMIYEQYGIPKEHNHLWYDKSGGFWDAPTWIINDDGGLNPGGALMRVWSEELYGLTYQQAFDFGPVDNKLYVGNLFSGGTSSVAAFVAAGDTTGSVKLRISSGSSIHVSSPFGVESDLPVVGGIAILPVGELPVYVNLTSGQACQVIPRSYGENLALRQGVVVAAGGSQPYPTDPNEPNNPQRLVNGILENWVWRQWYQDSTWLSNNTTWPETIEVDIPTTESVSDVLIYATVPWQVAGTLLDYQIQYWNGQNWTEIEHVVEPTKTFKNYTPAIRCSVDSFFSDRCVFEHHFSPVTTNKIRLVINDVTFGGGPTSDAVAAGGFNGPHQVSLREIEVYKAVPITGPIIDQSPASQTLATTATATFTVSAHGNGTLTYLWRKNGVAISNATSNVLTQPNLTLSDAGSYTVEVTNTAGTAISQPATLKITSPFSNWASQYFSSDQIANPKLLLQSTPQGDGISILLKYYFGLNPLQPSTTSDRARLPKTGTEFSGGFTYVTLTYTINPQATDVVVSPEKGDLPSNVWNPAVPDIIANLSNDPVTGNPRTCFKYKVNSSSSSFYRLSFAIP